MRLAYGILFLFTATLVLAQAPRSPARRSRPAPRHSQNVTPSPKHTQNPVGDIVSIPFQFNFNSDGAYQRSNLLQPQLPARHPHPPHPQAHLHRPHHRPHRQHPHRQRSQLQRRRRQRGADLLHPRPSRQDHPAASAHPSPFPPPPPTPPRPAPGPAEAPSWSSPHPAPSSSAPSSSSSPP